jgi:hypothetical protein
MSTRTQHQKKRAVSNFRLSDARVLDTIGCEEIRLSVVVSRASHRPVAFARGLAEAARRDGQFALD